MLSCGLPGGLNIAAVLLMLMGTQWYLLFNVIAGTVAIPQDLRDTTSLLRLSRPERWRNLILPALFPYLVTGAITATGGAWNASIVAEHAQFGGRTLATAGIGATIAAATGEGELPASARIYAGIDPDCCDCQSLVLALAVSDRRGALSHGVNVNPTSDRGEFDGRATQMNCRGSAPWRLPRIAQCFKKYGIGARQFVALQDINMRVKAGEFVCLLGPSGCGKSTLLRIMQD